MVALGGALSRRLLRAGLLAGGLGCSWLASAAAAERTSTSAAPRESGTAKAGEWRLLGPARINRRETPRVELLLKTPPGVSESELQLLANVGEVRLLRADGPGRWRLRYELPSEKYPGVALIAVHGGERNQLATLRMELMGYPTVEIHSEPWVSVLVEAGATRFGPVSTDHLGRAHLDVAVPPSVREVTTFATDQRGNVRESQVPLTPPPFSRLLLVCDRESPGVYVLSVNELGAPAGRAAFQITAEHARASTATRLAPGLFRVELRPEAREGAPSELQVHARLAGEDRHCSLPWTPEPVPALPPARERVPLLAGIQLGASSNLGKLAGPWGALHLAYPLGSAEVGWRLEAEAAYSRSKSRLHSATGVPLSLSVAAVPVVGSVRYALALGRWQGSAAASLGLAWVDLQAESASGLEQQSAYPLWIGGAVRGAYLFSGGEAGLELGYADAEVHAEAIRGNAAGLRATLGYLFHL